jgi:hypothetical protein
LAKNNKRLNQQLQAAHAARRQSLQFLRSTVDTDTPIDKTLQMLDMLELVGMCSLRCHVESCSHLYVN